MTRMDNIITHHFRLITAIIFLLSPCYLKAETDTTHPPLQSAEYDVSYEIPADDLILEQPAFNDDPLHLYGNQNTEHSSEVVDIDKQDVFALRGSNEDLWQRIRQGFAMPDLDGPLIEDRVQWYVARPEYIQRMIARSSRYLFYIVQELEQRHMPTELALLPFIESAFDPHAKSPAKAVGMWQFIPSTGKDFNLRQNVFQDERRDVLASTRAALDYLKQLYDQFQDWHLALAAYNWGQGSVSKAIARNQRAGLPTDYMSLKMPLETRYYVPKLQALKNLISNPEQFALQLPKIDNNPYFVTVTTTRDIDINLAAHLADLPLEEFKALNPSFNRPVIISATRPQILLPFKNAEKFQQNLSNYDKPLSSWTAVKTYGREKIEKLAKHFGISPQTLRSVNNIPKGKSLMSGSTIVIPRTAKINTDISTVLAENAKIELAPDSKPHRKITIKAGRRDTLQTIAARYGVSTSHIRTWNKLSDQQLVAGKRLSIYVDASKHNSRKSTRRIASTRVTKKSKTILTSRGAIQDLN